MWIARDGKVKPDVLGRRDALVMVWMGQVQVPDLTRCPNTEAFYRRPASTGRLVAILSGHLALTFAVFIGVYVAPKTGAARRRGGRSVDGRADRLAASLMIASYVFG